MGREELQLVLMKLCIPRVLDRLEARNSLLARPVAVLIPSIFIEPLSVSPTMINSSLQDFPFSTVFQRHRYHPRSQ